MATPSQETTVPLTDEGPSLSGGASSAEHEETVELLRYRKGEQLEDIKIVSRERDGEADKNSERLCGVTGDIHEEQRSGEDSDGAGAESDNWPVALGVFIILTMTNMVGPCFSIIFSPFLLGLGSSSTTVAMIFDALALIWFTSGLFIGPLVEEFGWRKVSMMCSLLFFSSIVLSAFATSALFLIFSFSILGGISGGLMNNLGFLIIPYYFKRRRGVANACATSGVCMGQIVGPILVRFLQEEFGFFGATFILGAVILHCCVGTSLLRPTHGHAKENTPVRAGDPVPNGSGGGTVEKKRKYHISGNAICRVFRNSVTNLAILKSPRAAIIAVGGTLVINSYLKFLVFMPFAVQAAGHSLQAAGLCVTVSAVFNMLARFTVSSLTDWPRFSIRVCYMTSTAIIATSIVVFSVVEDIRWQTAIMGVWGCGVGGFMGIFNLIMAHYMGLDKMAPTMGTTLLVNGFGFITLGPFIGLIRDVSGSYAVSMWVMAGLGVGSFILWLFMPAAVRYDRNKSNNTPPMSPTTDDSQLTHDKQ